MKTIKKGCRSLNGIKANGIPHRGISRCLRQVIFSAIGLLGALPFTNVLHAGDLGVGFRACTGGSCPSSYGSTGITCGIIGNDSGPSVYVGGDFTISTAGPAEAEGVLVVGGNFINDKPSGIYNVGVAGVGSCVGAEANTTHIFVAGNTTPANGPTPILVGALGILGNAEQGDFASSANYRFDTGGTALPLSDPDLATTVDDQIALFQTSSQCLLDFDSTANPSDQYQEASLVSQFGTITLDCPGTTKVGGKCPAGSYIADIDRTSGTTDLDVGYVSNIDTTSNFTDDDNTTIVINVMAAGVVAVRLQPAGPAFSSDFARSLLWNFVNASRVDFEGNSQFNGTVLIPYGGAIINASGMNGRFIAAGDVLHQAAGSEFHNFDFIGDIPDVCEPDLNPPTSGDTTGTPAVTVGDLVWVEVGVTDGEFDSSTEKGIGGVTVNLRNEAGTVINTTETDQTGQYFFSTDSSGTLLPLGSYSVQVIEPEGLSFTTPNVIGVDDELDSDVDSSGISPLVLIPVNTNRSLDVGLIVPPGSCDVASTDLGGNVFRDYNADGADAGTFTQDFTLTDILAQG